MKESEAKKELKKYLDNQKLYNDNLEDIEREVSNSERMTSILSKVKTFSNVLSDKVGDGAAKIIDLTDENFKLCFELAESKQTIENKIKTLKQPYKNILYYHYIKGKKLSEVSTIIDRSYSYTKKLHREAIKLYAKI